MQIGMIGLGKMGGSMALRLLRTGHDVVGFDLDESLTRPLIDDGLNGTVSAEALVRHVIAPRHIWMMVPAGDVVDAVIAELLPGLSEGATRIDGGNWDYRNTLRRRDELATRGIELDHVGANGGVVGFEVA